MIPHQGRNFRGAVLRMAVALETQGVPSQAQTLVDWVAAQAGANRGLLPELYDRETADYAGAVPMAGFGGAAFRLAVDLVDEDDSCFDPVVDPLPDGGLEDAGVDAGGGKELHAGCACRVSSGRNAGWLLVAVVLVLNRRLRRTKGR